MVRLALLRHGKTAWNREGRLQGRTDIPLDPEAEAELAALALPQGWEAADLVSSPLQRARQTGALVAQRSPRIEPALMEMNWGDWEGQRGADLRAAGAAHKDITDWGWHYTPPNGESPDALRARLRPWLEGLDRDTLAVCHIGVMRVLLALATGWQFDGPPPFQIKRNRLYVLKRDGDRWTWQEDIPRLIGRTR